MTGASSPTGAIPIHLDPNILRLGPLLISWHGFFTAVGTVVGVWLAVRWATRAGFSEDQTVSVAMWGVVGAIVGARLFHVVDQWEAYARDPLAILRVNEGGIAIFGAVVGGPLAGAIYAWRRGLDIGRLADVAAPCLALGMGIGRIGDVINGEHHGAPAPGFPLAVVYTHPNTLGEPGLPVHLAVGYELLLDLAIFGILVWLARGVARGPDGRLTWRWRPRTPRGGMLFWTFLALYSAGRFVVQFYRVDSPFLLGLSQAQLSSVLSGMVAAWALVYLAARRPASRARGPGGAAAAGRRAA